MGILRNMYIPKPNPFDIIPVDVVSNSILISTAYHADASNRELMTIYNCTTTAQNPITMEGYKDVAMSTLKFGPIHNRVFAPATIHHSRGKVEHDIRKTLFEVLPLRAMELVSKLPTAPKDLAKSAKDLRKVQDRLDGMYDIFEFFINGDWTYCNNRIYSVINCLSDDEKVDFACDVMDINWFTYLGNYLRGMSIWVLKQDLIVPAAGLE